MSCTLLLGDKSIMKKPVLSNRSDFSYLQLTRSGKNGLMNLFLLFAVSEMPSVHLLYQTAVQNRQAH